MAAIYMVCNYYFYRRLNTLPKHLSDQFPRYQLRKNTTQLTHTSSLTWSLSEVLHTSMINLTSWVSCFMRLNDAMSDTGMQPSLDIFRLMNMSLARFSSLKQYSLKYEGKIQVLLLGKSSALVSWCCVDVLLVQAYFWNCSHYKFWNS